MFNLQLMGIKQESPSVFRVSGNTFYLTAEHISLLRQSAAVTPLGRARICLHTDDAAKQHEMLIAFTKNSYVCPHMHPEKSESFHHILGSFLAILFDKTGNIIGRQKIDAETPYLRINSGVFHTLIPLEDCSIIHEVTSGPFMRSQTIEAPFAPQTNSLDITLKYQNQLLEG